MQQPTGAGKSLIIAALAAQFIREHKPILAIAHKRELICQLRDHLHRWTGVEIGIIANKKQFKPNPDAPIQVASIQALNRKSPELLPPAELIIVDEAHHSSARSYSKIFDHYCDKHFLGVTATPMRIDGRGLKTLYDGVPGYQELVLGVPVRELIEREYLCDFRIFAGGDTLLDPEAAGIHSRRGDYVEKELEAYARKVLLQGDIVDSWYKYAQGKRTVVYPVSVKLSQEYCAQFQERGVRAAHIDAKTPAKQRAAIIEEFREGKILVLCQHSIVIEGVDIPRIEAVQFARPTKSLTIWFQAVGRALRPAPGKDHCVIIDHTTNHVNLPWVDTPLEWSLDPMSLPKGVTGSLQCDQCRHVFLPTEFDEQRQYAICPNCGHQIKCQPPEQEPNREEQALEVGYVETELEEQVRELNPVVMAKMENLFFQQQTMGYKPSWVYFRLVDECADVGYFELLELSKRLGYKPGWAWYKHRELKKAQELRTLEVLWELVLRFVEPATTRALLSTRTRLVKLSDGVAVVEVESGVLMRLMRGRVDNVELAFIKCGYVVQVALRVGKQDSSGEGSSSYG